MGNVIMQLPTERDMEWNISSSEGEYHRTKAIRCLMVSVSWGLCRLKIIVGDNIQKVKTPIRLAIQTSENMLFMSNFKC